MPSNSFFLQLLCLYKPLSSCLYLLIHHPQSRKIFFSCMFDFCCSPTFPDFFQCLLKKLLCYMDEVSSLRDFISIHLCVSKYPGKAAVGRTPGVHSLVVTGCSALSLGNNRLGASLGRRELPNFTLKVHVIFVSQSNSVSWR